MLTLGSSVLFGCQKGKISEKPAQMPVAAEIQEEPETELEDNAFEEEAELSSNKEPELLDAERVYWPPPKVMVWPHLGLCGEMRSMEDVRGTRCFPIRILLFGYSGDFTEADRAEIQEYVSKTPGLSSCSIPFYYELPEMSQSEDRDLVPEQLQGPEVMRFKKIEGQWQPYYRENEPSL